MGDFAWQTVTSYNQSATLKSKEDTRNFKGYWFEMHCRREFVNIPNLEYDSNPSGYSDWLQNHNKNSFDATVTYANGATDRLEMKFVSDGVKIESSWFRRDWLPREANLIVTNNPTAIKYRDKREAERQGKKILSVTEAKVYLSKKAYNLAHPNQLSSWNSPICRIITDIQARTSKIINKITSLWAKIRLKTANPAIEINDKAILPAPTTLEYQPLSQISQDKIACIWSSLESNIGMPTINAYVFSGEEYQRVLDYYVNSISKKGYSEAQITQVKEAKGITEQVNSKEYRIALLQATPQAEDEALTQEIAKISWRYWSQFHTGNCQGYVR